MEKARREKQITKHCKKRDKQFAFAGLLQGMLGPQFAELSADMRAKEARTFEALVDWANGLCNQLKAMAAQIDAIKNVKPWIGAIQVQVDHIRADTANLRIASSSIERELHDLEQTMADLAVVIRALVALHKDHPRVGKPPRKVRAKAPPIETAPTAVKATKHQQVLPPKSAAATPAPVQRKRRNAKAAAWKPSGAA